MKKVLFISSAGGHLSELSQLEELFHKYDSYFVSERNKTTSWLSKKYPDKTYYLSYGTKDHLIKYAFIFPWNIIKSIYLFLKIRPSIIITTGTHTAVPMCYIAKLFQKKVIFIETFANIESRTLAGRLVYPISDLFIVQWESMKKYYPKSVYGGWIYK